MTGWCSGGGVWIFGGAHVELIVSCFYVVHADDGVWIWSWKCRSVEGTPQRQQCLDFLKIGHRLLVTCLDKDGFREVEEIKPIKPGE
jgi:hypothetical protein